MILPPPDSLERLTHADLIGVVRDLIGELTRMRAETEKLDGALAKLRVEHQAVKDELARLKHLPPRPPIKPSGMDKATQAKGPEAGDEKRSSRRRGSQLDRLKIGATIVVKADPPAGSRNKGFEEDDACIMRRDPAGTHFVSSIKDRLIMLPENGVDTWKRK